MNNKKRQRRVPFWMLALIILCMLPAAVYPVWLMHSQETFIPDSDRPFLWFYPIYTLVCGFLAWQQYGRRTYMTCILLILMLMTHASMVVLSLGY